MNQLRQSLGYWITSLPTKSGDIQFLHQVTHSSTPEYFMLLYKLQQLRCVAFNCLRGWDIVTIKAACWSGANELEADQSQGCAMFAELFG